jgi:single-stranded-DNA-specific exonuclease
MPEWIDPPSPVAPPELREAVGGHPLVAELLARRGIRSPEVARAFIDPSAYDPAPPHDLPDLGRGAAIARRAVAEGDHVLVWGDFDVDGQTSTALLVSVLEELGGRVSFHIPRRETESHGVNTARLRPYLEKGVDLLLTCDTGVASHEAIRLARQSGAKVVVTDHHDLPPRLPDADAIINPKRLPPEHPLRSLPGVGVAYKFAEAITEPTDVDPTRHLDLVALGTVADIAYLRQDTRYLTQRGLEVLRGGGRTGLAAIMDRAGVDPSAADEEDIGYRIAPRLNALGRLADASPAVPLLTTEQREEAEDIARRLEELNDTRRLLTDQVYEAAKDQIDGSPELLQYAVLVLHAPQWPAGVIGIVASRLVDDYHKPTILLTDQGDGSDPPLARGSARSIEGLDISAAIAEQSDLLTSHGGHPMAAGLTLPRRAIGRFRRLVSRAVAEQKGGEEFTPTLTIDSYVSLDDLTLGLADELSRLAPFGPGNRPVTLACRDLVITNVREIGRSGEHLKVTVACATETAGNGPADGSGAQGTTREVLYWNGTKRDLPTGTFDLAVTLSANAFRGERSAQLTWQDARPTGTRPDERASGESGPAVVDHRSSGDRVATLRELARQTTTQIWMEARSAPGIAARTRDELGPCAHLVLGTLPPSRRVLRAACERCDPDVIHVVGLGADVDGIGPFTRRLLGLAKHAINTGKRFSPQALAGAMGHDEWTVILGLKWLQRRGKITVSRDENGLCVDEGRSLRSSLGRAPDELQQALEETRAFREYAFEGLDDEDSTLLA